MNKTKGTSESPELWSPDRTQGTSLATVAPSFAVSWKAMDKALNVILIVVIFVVMVSLGCTKEIAKITAHLREPKGVAVAIMAQYGIMPLTAFIWDKLFQLQNPWPSSCVAAAQEETSPTSLAWHREGRGTSGKGS